MRSNLSVIRSNSCFQPPTNKATVYNDNRNNRQNIKKNNTIYSSFPKNRVNTKTCLNKFHHEADIFIYQGKRRNDSGRIEKEVKRDIFIAYEKFGDIQRKLCTRADNMFGDAVKALLFHEKGYASANVMQNIIPSEAEIVIKFFLK